VDQWLFVGEISGRFFGVFASKNRPLFSPTNRVDQSVDQQITNRRDGLARDLKIRCDDQKFENVERSIRAPSRVQSEIQNQAHASLLLSFNTSDEANSTAPAAPPPKRRLKDVRSLNLPPRALSVDPVGDTQSPLRASKSVTSSCNRKDPFGRQSFLSANARDPSTYWQNLSFSTPHLLNWGVLVGRGMEGFHVINS
jgi:hypothetical protein